MTPEERTARVIGAIAPLLEASPVDLSAVGALIADAIREAVKEAINPWEEAAQNRAAQRARSWTQLDQARTALEPFARVPIDGNDPDEAPVAVIVPARMFRAARAAYLALK